MAALRISAAGPIVASGMPSRCFARNQLVEVAAFSAGGFILYQKSQVAFIKFSEPVVPSDRFERLLAAVSGEVQTNHTCVLYPAGAAYACRCCTALFRPLPDFLMIG